MIQRMPQPPCPLFSPDETPQFIELGGTWTRSEYHLGVDVLQHGGFFNMAITVVGLMCNTRAVSRTPLPLTAISTTWRRTSGTRPRSWYWRRKIRRAHCPF